jgi:hypothetical protein
MKSNWMITYYSGNLYDENHKVLGFTCVKDKTYDEALLEANKDKPSECTNWTIDETKW